jgi:hypothetical protein
LNIARHIGAHVEERGHLLPRRLRIGPVGFGVQLRLRYRIVAVLFPAVLKILLAELISVLTFPQRPQRRGSRSN